MRFSFVPGLFSAILVVVFLLAIIYKRGACDESPVDQCPGTYDLDCRGAFWTWADSHHNSDGKALSIGYGVAIFLLLLYFVWETGPMHMSQDTEAGYIVGTLFFICTCTAMAIMVQPVDYWMDKNWLLLMILVIVRIAKVAAAPKQLPAFYERASNAELILREQDGKLTSPKVVATSARLTAELQASVSAMLNAEVGSIGAMPDGVFATVLLVVIMAIQLIHHFDDFQQFVRKIFGTECVIMWIALVVVLSEVRRFSVVGPHKDHLYAIMRKVVDDTRETMGKENHRRLVTHVLSRISVGTLMEVADQRTTAVITDKALERGLLDVSAKAIVIDALQKRGLRQQVRRQQAVARILKSASGKELTQLKNMIDYGGDYYNLTKLVYRDVANSHIRREILEHFQAEASAERRAMNGASVGVKILSDIDDTLYSSGGKFPAGVDKKYPPHVVYPGCCGLMKVLDARGTETECNLVFLSARPHVYKDVAEEHSHRLFKSLVSEGRMHALPTLIPGSLFRSLFATVFYACLKTRAWRMAGDFKYITYLDYTRLYGEYDFVFCGDNGQGDLLAGQKMVKHVRLEEDSDSSDDFSDVPPNVQCVLIHEVMPQRDALALERSSERPDTWTEDLERRRLFFFKTYVGAAVALNRRLPALLSAENLRNVVNAAIESFEYAVNMYPVWDWEEARHDLANDIWRANQILSTTPGGEIPVNLDQILEGAQPPVPTKGKPKAVRRSLCGDDSEHSSEDSGEFSEMDNFM